MRGTLISFREMTRSKSIPIKSSKGLHPRAQLAQKKARPPPVEPQLTMRKKKRWKPITNSRRQIIREQMNSSKRVCIMGPTAQRRMLHHAAVELVDMGQMGGDVRMSKDACTALQVVVEDRMRDILKRAQSRRIESLSATSVAKGKHIKVLDRNLLGSFIDMCDYHSGNFKDFFAKNYKASLTEAKPNVQQ